MQPKKSKQTKKLRRRRSNCKTDKREEKLRSLKGFLPESKSFKNTIDFLSSKKTRPNLNLFHDSGMVICELLKNERISKMFGQCLKRTSLVKIFWTLKLIPEVELPHPVYIFTVFNIKLCFVSYGIGSYICQRKQM